MRVLKATLYMAPNMPLTSVTRDSDVTDSLESARQKLADQELEAFNVFDIFDMPDGDMQEAIFESMRRTDAQREQNQAILYFWCVGHLPKLSANGVMAAPDPSPLTADEVAMTLEQVVKHSQYQNQTLRFPCEDGQLVTVRGDTTDVTPIPGEET